MPIKNWIWLFSGYTETRREVCGTEKLFLSLRDLEPRDTLIEFDEWDADPQGIANYIDRNAAVDPRIVIVGYSWGGQKAVNVCRALSGHGLLVRELVLCDAVYRSDWQPEWMARRGIPLNLKSLLRTPKIVVPGNVRRVSWVRQNIDRRLQGHDVTAESEQTEISPGPRLPCTHGEIDERPEFHQMALTAVSTLMIEKTP